MKASFFAAVATMALAAIAAPTPSDANLGALSQTLEKLPVLHSLGGAAPTPSASATPSAATSASAGHLVQDLGSQVDHALTITGPDAKKLLIQLSPEVAGLISGLGLTGLAAPVGSIVKSAASVGDLVKDLGPEVDGLLTVVGKDVGALLIKLSPGVAGLLAGLGLPGVGASVGEVVGTLGADL